MQCRVLDDLISEAQHNTQEFRACVIFEELLGSLNGPPFAQRAAGNRQYQRRSSLMPSPASCSLSPTERAVLRHKFLSLVCCIIIGHVVPFCPPRCDEKAQSVEEGSARSIRERAISAASDAEAHIFDADLLQSLICFIHDDLDDEQCPDVLGMLLGIILWGAWDGASPAS